MDTATTTTSSETKRFRVMKEISSPIHPTIHRLQNESCEIIRRAQGLRASSSISEHQKAQQLKRPLLKPICRPGGNKRKVSSSILSTMAYPSTRLVKKRSKTVDIVGEHIQMDKIYRFKSMERVVFNTPEKAKKSSPRPFQERKNSPFPDQVFSSNFCEMPRAFSPYFGSDIALGGESISSRVHSLPSFTTGGGSCGDSSEFNKTLRKSSDIEEVLKSIGKENEKDKTSKARSDVSRCI